MANWQRTLNLLPEWKEAKAGEITPHQMARVVADRLSEMRPFMDGEAWVDDGREELADSFADFSRDEGADAEEFDDLMEALYSWADTHISGGFFNARKACWVKTF